MPKTTRKGRLNGNKSKSQATTGNDDEEDGKRGSKERKRSSKEEASLDNFKRRDKKVKRVSSEHRRSEEARSVQSIPTSQPKLSHVSTVNTGQKETLPHASNRPTLKLKMRRKVGSNALSKDDLAQCISEEHLRIAKEMAALVLLEAKQRKAARKLKRSAKRKAKEMKLGTQNTDDGDLATKGKVGRPNEELGKEQSPHNKRKRTSGTTDSASASIAATSTSDKVDGLIAIGYVEADTLHPLAQARNAAPPREDSGLSADDNEAINGEPQESASDLGGSSTLQPPFFLWPKLWASSRIDMMECSPVFPEGANHVKQSIGGFATGLLLSHSNFMTSINLTKDELIIHLNDARKGKNVLQAMSKSCHADVSLNIFAEASSVPMVFPCQPGAAYFYAGDYCFMEWRQESDRHRIVLQRREECHIERKYVHDIPRQADLSASLFQGVVCQTCFCALSARDWAGWSCQYCSQFYPAPPVRVQLHRYFAKANISYSGPRMDNGKAVIDASTGVKRRLEVWSDGMKSAHYLLSLEDSDRQFYHLLSSSELEVDSTRLFNLLLDREMPYRRCTSKMTFHASFCATDIVQDPASSMFVCHQNALSSSPNAVKDVADAIGSYVSRFVAESVEGFNDLSIVLSQGDAIDLLARSGHCESVAAHRAILHLGPAAQVIIRELGSGKEIVSLSLTHGDLLYLPQSSALAKDFQMRVLHSEVSMTCIARRLPLSSSVLSPM